MRVVLVGAIDGQIKLGHSVDRRKRDGIKFRLRAGALGGGHADHLQACGNPRAKKCDKMRRRRAGPKAEPHAGDRQAPGLWRRPAAWRRRGCSRAWGMRWLRRGRPGLVPCGRPRQPRALVGARRKRLYIWAKEVRAWLRLQRIFSWIRPPQISSFRPPMARPMRSTDVAGEKGTVIVFICNHCPYVKAVIDRLAADARVLMAEGIRLRRHLRERCQELSGGFLRQYETLRKPA